MYQSIIEEKENKIMFNILKNLINKKFYSNRDEAIAKVDTCYAMGKLTVVETEEK